MEPGKLCVLLILFLLLSASFSYLAQSQEKPEGGVFHIPLQISDALEPRREQLEAALRNAQRRAFLFASQYGWENKAVTPFADRAEIYDEKARFDNELRRLFGKDARYPIPSTYCAALEHGVLAAVSPAIYGRNYPEGEEPDAYEKLLCHEMLHQLHIRILDYDEDAMGPVWFYEGFAIYGSGQFEDALPVLGEKEIWRIVRSEKRMSYRKYAVVIRYFLRKKPLPELVKRASDKDFIQWLESTKNSSENGQERKHK